MSQREPRRYELKEVVLRLEEGRNLYEVMDLGFGKCKMCVCGPESARELLTKNEIIRVATKYPNIAKNYFKEKKGLVKKKCTLYQFHI